MADKLVLPNPARKSAEHEKWKAMVDSVVEFIAASRTMLHALNDRINVNEKQGYENTERLEEEKVKLQFYEEYLNSTINHKQETNKAVTLPTKNQESGDTGSEKEKEQTYFIYGRSNDNILKKSRKNFPSRIPKTRSYVEESNKYFRGSQNEAAHTGSFYKSRRATEIGYSTIHQRNNKAPRGDVIS